MKHRLLLLLLTFISITSFGQAWQDGGNGLQFRYVGGFREVRQLVKTPQPPFAITDSLNAKGIKQNSLATDGTGVKYPTVDAINSGVVKLTTDQTINGLKQFLNSISVGGVYNSNPLPGDSEYSLDVINNAGDNYHNSIRVTSYANSDGLNTFVLSKARGTELTPLSVLNGDYISAIAARGYNGSAFPGSSTAINSIATENFTPTANGTKMTFEVMPNGTISSRIKAITLENSGNLTAHKDTELLGFGSVGGIHNLNPNTGEGPHVFDILNNDTGNTQNLIQMSTYSNSGGHSNFHSRFARGTKDVPLAAQSGDYAISMGFRFHNGTDFSGSSAAIQAIATENITPTANGTMLRFQTMPNGSFGGGRVTALDLNQDGSANFFSFINTGAYDGQALLFKKATSGGNNFIRWQDEGGVNQSYIGIFGATDDLNLFSSSDLKINSVASVFLQEGGGKVAVGSSTTPIEALDVTGKIRVSVAAANPTDVPQFQQLSTYAPLASPALTGNPTAPTATAGTNTAQIATTAFVQSAMSLGSSGSYTPTITAINNCTVTATNKALYSRNGDNVTVTGRMSVTITSANTATYLSITFPIPSNIGTGSDDLSGVCTLVPNSSSTPGSGGYIEGDNINDYALVRLVSTSVSGTLQYINYSFTYIVK